MNKKAILIAGMAVVALAVAGFYAAPLTKGKWLEFRAAQGGSSDVIEYAEHLLSWSSDSSRTDKARAEAMKQDAKTLLNSLALKGDTE